MTWAKFGSEFFDQLVDKGFPHDLDDACQLTHTQALHYLYSVEAMDMTFPKNVLRRFATSALAERAAAELVKQGLWDDRINRYKVIHHEDVFRQSLSAQESKRKRDKERQRKIRSGNGGVASGVVNDVASDVAATQSVSHTANKTKQAFKEKEESKNSSSAPSIDFDTGEVLDDEPVASLNRYVAMLDEHDEFEEKHKRESA